MLMRNMLLCLLVLLPLPVFASPFDAFITRISSFSVTVESLITLFIGVVIGIGASALAIYYGMQFLRWARRVA